MSFIEVVKSLVKSFKYYDEEFGDPRSMRFHFIHVSWPIGIAIFYLIFTLYLGPKIMKNRPPFDIQRIVTTYNIFQIFCNGYLLVSSVFTSYVLLRYSLICQPVGSGTSPEELHVVYLTWLYYLIKIVDLLDTVFIILRKKNSQLSVLHIYHHTGMVIASWIGLKFAPGGQSILTGSINTFVHTVMYSYYLLTTMDSKYRSSWWKKHITQLQFGQFAAVALHHSIALLNPECTYPKLLSYLLLPPMLLLTYLFIVYYRNEYIKKSK